MSNGPATTLYLTSADVGAILGKSQRTVTRMADRGAIPFAQKLPGPNGPYLFTRANVDAYLASRTQGSAA